MPRHKTDWGKWLIMPFCFSNCDKRGVFWVEIRNLFPGKTNSIAWKRWLLWNKWMLHGKLRWRSYKLVGRCKLSLYENESCDEHAVYFWRWLKWRAMFITFLLSSNDLYLYKRIFWRKYSLNILNLLNFLKNTRPSIKWEEKPFSEEILLRVELIASLSLI